MNSYNLAVFELEVKISLLKTLLVESKQRTKARKLIVEVAKKDAMCYGSFEDCGDSYQENYAIEQSLLRASIEEKIRIEKTWRYFRHRLNELEI